MDFDQTARMMDDQYIQRVHDYEVEGTHTANASPEVSRFVYIIFGAVEFAHVLRNLVELLQKVLSPIIFFTLNHIKG